MMLLTKLKQLKVLLVTISLLGTTAASVAYYAGGDEPVQTTKDDPMAKGEQVGKIELADLQKQLEQLRDQNETLKQHLVAKDSMLAQTERRLKEYLELNKRISKKEATQKQYVLGPLHTSSIDASQLIEVIRKTIEPSSWAGAGGTGSIIYYEPSKAIIVNTTTRIYEDIFSMVSMFDKEQLEKRTAEKKFVQKVYPVGDLAGKSGDSLIRVITNTIERASWVNHGGNASIEYFSDGQSLVIVNHPEIHTRIETLLTDLRKAKAEQEKKAP